MKLVRQLVWLSPILRNSCDKQGGGEEKQFGGKKKGEGGNALHSELNNRRWMGATITREERVRGAY